MLSGGWKGLLCLRDSIIDSDFAGLNDTSHLTAQACIRLNSWVLIKLSLPVEFVSL